MRILIDIATEDYLEICKSELIQEETIVALINSVRKGALTTDIVSAVMVGIQNAKRENEDFERLIGKRE